MTHQDELVDAGITANSWEDTIMKFPASQSPPTTSITYQMPRAARLQFVCLV